MLLILLLIPSVFNLLGPGFFESDDGEWMVIRFSAFYSSLSDGQFPVRFLERLNHGFGYPVSNFLYPGFMYLASPLKLLGLSFVSSIKIILILSMLGGGFFAFKWLSKIFDQKSALVGALFYTYAPYHLYDLYKRGSVGEVLSIAILPFIFWQIERENFLFTTIGISLLIISHNSLAVLFLFLVTAYMGVNLYVSKKRKTLGRNYLTTLFLGFGMASFFWIPAIFELDFTRFSDIQISQWQNYFADLKLIGVSTLALFLICLSLIVFRKIKPGEHRLTIMFFVIGLGSIFFSSQLSSWLWKTFPSSFIQFPFRFLSLVVPSVAFIAACVVYVSEKKTKYIIMGVLLSILVFSSFDFLAPEVKTNKDDSFYSTNEGTTNVKDEYLPYWVKEKPITRFDQKVEILEDGDDVKNLSYNSKRINFTTSFDEQKTARINTIFYPGWIARVNGTEWEIDYSNIKGVMDLRLPSGRNDVELIFRETNLRIFADLISVISTFLLLVWRRKDMGLIK